VTWDQDVIDNEGMSRKSSKRCCIFHKQRDFGESSTDSSDEDNVDDDDSENRGGGGDANSDGLKQGGGKVARPKKSTVPDFQRFHA
jgi:protein phosphatase 1 regulatory subunit 11